MHRIVELSKDSFYQQEFLWYRPKNISHRILTEHYRIINTCTDFLTYPTAVVSNKITTESNKLLLTL